jgi:hypothetical protein
MLVKVLVLVVAVSLVDTELGVEYIPLMVVQIQMLVLVVTADLVV